VRTVKILKIKNLSNSKTVRDRPKNFNRYRFHTLLSIQCSNLANLGVKINVHHQKNSKKLYREYLQYFFYFKEKKLYSVFTILQIICKFQRNWPRKVPVDLNGLCQVYFIIKFMAVTTYV
jgi:hypothetical protein